MTPVRKPFAILFALSMILLSMTPLATADGSSQAPSSYAFLPSWSGGIPGDLDPSGETVAGMEFTNHGFDDEGNMYYLEVDDYGKGHVAECILIISKYQLSDAQVVDKEINVMAMIIEILGVIK